MSSTTAILYVIDKFMNIYSGLGQGTRIGNITGNPDGEWMDDWIQTQMENLLEGPFKSKFFSDTGETLLLSEVLEAAVLGGPKMLTSVKIQFESPWTVSGTPFAYSQITHAAQDVSRVGDVTPTIQRIIEKTGLDYLNTSPSAPTQFAPNLGVIDVTHNELSPKFANTIAATVLKNITNCQNPFFKTGINPRDQSLVNWFNCSFKA